MILKTCKQVIDGLGGVKAFPQRTQTCRTSPYNYIARGTFPPEVSVRILAECARDGLSVDLRVFDGLSLETVKLIASATVTQSQASRKGKR